MGSLIETPPREARIGKRVVIVNGEVMLEAWPDGAPTHVRRVLASDPVSDGVRAGVTVPVSGGMAATLAALAAGVPEQYGAAWDAAVGMMLR